MILNESCILAFSVLCRTVFFQNTMFKCLRAACVDFKVKRLHSHADAVFSRFTQGQGTNYIDEAIVVDRQALELCPPDHSQRALSLTRLQRHLWDRYNEQGAIGDIEESVALGRQALGHRPKRHPDRWMSLSYLAICLSTRYKQRGAITDLEEVIDLGREALDLCPRRHPSRSMLLTTLAADTYARFKHLGMMSDLDTAIVLGRETLDLCPLAHPSHSMSLNNLACYLTTRYKQLGVVTDLDDAIAFGCKALELCPPGHPDRSTPLNSVALSLSTRYEQYGAMTDLDEAIVLKLEALSLCEKGHPLRSTSLNNLAADLSTRYKELGVMSDLDEAIELGQEGLDLCPDENPDRSMYLNNVAYYRLTRYKQIGRMKDLDGSIIFGRDALHLRPQGHPLRSTTLNNLAYSVYTRYAQLGVIADLNEAVVLGREALDLCPRGHSDRSRSLNNVAIFLSTRYKQLGEITDLDGAIILVREALHLCPSGHPLRLTSLNSVSHHLYTRYKNLGVMEDLDEAMVLGREAVNLCSPGHPDRSTSLRIVALCLSIRYKQFGEMTDLDEAIGLAQDALQLCPTGRPDRSELLHDLTGYLHTRFTSSGQLKDKDDLFILYNEMAHVPQMLSSSDVSVSKAWIKAAEDLHHSTTLLAYETSLRSLIQHLATLPSLPQHLPILRELTSSLAVDAFSACLRNHSPAKAVELLEQGRGVFWNQITRLHSPLDDVIGSGPTGKALADEFSRLTSLIRNAISLPRADQHDRLCRLNLELQGVATDIRELPGLSRFLLPPVFSDLQRAACGGPVIIVNSSKYSCDALVVFIDRSPVHIPLQITKERVRDLSSELHSLTARAKMMNIARELCCILRELWDEVVSPIVDFLVTTHPLRSRIWWCPTGEFSLLPLHAAGPHRAAAGQLNLPDLYISSYTPTLSALIRARRHDPSRSATRMKRLVAIGQAKAVGESELISVGTELAVIGQRIQDLATFTRVEGSESCVSRVTEELRKNEWVHLACHGIPDRRHPFDSAFGLHDGRFTVRDILGCFGFSEANESFAAEFAYLSACYTTVGDEECPDEVIHLASVMQFAGFRSVIGTMWAVDDGEANEIAAAFYERMAGSCSGSGSASGLDHTRAAVALNETMKKVVGVPFDQRVLYIHIGA